VPYQALQANVARLQRIQQANDALRRTARFAVLAKRLEAQMNELGGYANAGSGREKRAGIGANGPLGDHQEDKERTIAKAALSIAELSACCVFGCRGCMFDGGQVPCSTDPTRIIQKRHTLILRASRRYRRARIASHCVPSTQQPHTFHSSLNLERKSRRKWRVWYFRGLPPWCVTYNALSSQAS
jgi:hypothetical protein